MDTFMKIPVAVKMSADLYSPSVQVKAQVDMFHFAKAVLQRCPDVTKRVKLVPTYHSDIEKVGRGQRMMCGDSSLSEGAKVVVQEYVRGSIQLLLKICNSNQIELPDNEELVCLLALVHESYTFSGGDCVIGAMKGVKIRDERGRMTYYVTSLTLHSRAQKYGEKDKGVHGIELYENWNSPAPPVQVSESRRRVSAGSPSVSPRSRSDVIPVPASPPPGDSSSQMRDALGANFPLYEEVLSSSQETRPVLLERLLRLVLGHPPPYSFTDADLHPELPSESSS